jgi:hypothetical protein
MSSPLRVISSIAITLRSPVGAHATSENSRPAGVSSTADEFFFVRSASSTWPSRV